MKIILFLMILLLVLMRVDISKAEESEISCLAEAIYFESRSE